MSSELFSVFASPGETLYFDLPHYDTSQLRLTLLGVNLGQPKPHQWVFSAPTEPGLYPLKLQHSATGDSVDLNLFVGVAAQQVRDQKLYNYRLGPPPPGNDKYPVQYASPRAFVQVTEQNRNTALSEHFYLGQFLCKQKSAYPKFVVIQESLLVLLEHLVEAVRDAGYPIDTFGVISAYRTPHYNRIIGNVSNSRHVYGDAMDLFIDVDGDGLMDDLNGDGRTDATDIDILVGIIEKFKRSSQGMLLVGGIGRYLPAAHHGGFVHVDTRGYRARW